MRRSRPQRASPRGRRGHARGRCRGGSARIRSSRRGSVSTMTRSSGSSRTRVRGGGRRRRPGSSGRRSTGWMRTSSPAASNRDSSIRSSTRIAQAADVLDHELARPARVGRQGIEMAAAGSTPRRRARRRACAARGSRPRRSAGSGPGPPRAGGSCPRACPTISLNCSAHTPNSSVEVTGTRADRSPRAIRSCGPSGLVDGGEDAAGDEPGGDHADDHGQDDRAGDQREPELAERLVDRASRRG